MKNNFFKDDDIERGFVLMMDIAGYIYWTYTATYLPIDGNMAVLDTKIGRNV